VALHTAQPKIKKNHGAPRTSSANGAFEREKRAYWQMRAELLKQYAHRWVAVVGGEVAAVGDSPTEVILAAYQASHSPVGYVNKVGDEAQARYRNLQRQEPTHPNSRPVDEV
jgi:hypothetical protein